MANNGKYIIVGLLVVWLLFFGGISTIGNIVCSRNPSVCGAGYTPPIITQTQSTTAGQPPSSTGWQQYSGTSTQMLVTVYNKDTSAALTATTYYDAIPVNNLGADFEKALAVNAAPVSSGQRYAAGDQYYLHVYSTGYYDNWYLMQVGGIVSRLVPPTVGTMSMAQNPTFTFQQVGTMSLTAGATPYWTFSAFTFALYARSSTSNLAGTITAQTNGAVLHSFIANKGYTNIGLGGTQTSNYTAIAKQFQLNLGISLGVAAVHWGQPIITLTSFQPYAFQVRYPVLWVAVNSTSIQSSYTMQTGFTPITVQPTGWWVGYETLPSVDGTPSTAGTSPAIPIQFDTTAIASSTVLRIAVWMGDVQYLVDVNGGTSDSSPTAYGGVSAYGITSVQPTSTYATTSNLPTNTLTFACITTY